MPFAIPKLDDLAGRARSAFRSYLPGSDAWLWPNNAYVLAKLVAGTVSEVFQFANYIFKQVFASTAVSENLELHAAEYGLARRSAAPAQGVVRLTTAGPVTVADAAVFQRLDGVQYIAAGGGSIAGGTLDVPVIAAVDGVAANAESGTALSFVSGIAGDATAIVAPTGIVGGADIEPDGDPFTTDL